MLQPLAHDDPDRFGPYRLLARLGSGGMGTVYLARSAGGRTVALKTMHAGIASDPASRTRFQLETDAARVIGGHHGATVIDADPLAETPWLATEYVLGPPLDDAVALAGPLPEASVRALGAALSGALAQLHGSDVVHRDLKPSNVMVTGYGPKIIDFGIARAAGDDRLTRTGSAAGTPAFMSPEQATGLEHTPAGDVFALAGVLVFAASGHGPFGTGQAADLLYRVRYADPDLGGVPDALVPILARCLSKDPAARLTTSQLISQLHDGGGQFADHLPDLVLAEIARRASEVWQFHPHRLPPPPPEPDSSRPTAVSRRKLLTMTGGSVLGVAAAGAGAWLWLGETEDDPSGKDADPAAGPRPLWNADTGKANERAHFLPLGNAIATFSGESFVGLSVKTGKELWASQQVIKGWNQITSDGTTMYGFLPTPDASRRLAVHTFTPAAGTPFRHVGTLDDYAGGSSDAQALAVAQGVLCLVARKYAAPHDEPGGQGKDWYALAVDLRTGKKLWENAVRAATPGYGSSDIGAAIVGDRLVLCRYENEDPEGPHDIHVFTTHLRTGERLWGTYVPRRIKDPANVVQNPLAVDDQHVYVSSGLIHALRLSDGKSVWQFGAGRNQGEIEPDQRAYGAPTVKGGVVYAVEGDRGLVALDAATGKLLWAEIEDLTKNETPDLEFPPVIGTKYAYVKLDTGIRAVDLRTRKSAWTYRSSPAFFAADSRAKHLICAEANTTTALPFQ